MDFLKAKLTDIDSMQELVKEDIQNGIILFRSDNEVATNIRSYTVIKDKNSIVGYGALHIHTKTLAEVRSLVIDLQYRSKGLGSKLVKKMLEEGRELGVKQVFTLTYKKEFFERLGFNEIEKESLPEQKIWADCIKCKHFPVCNEVSLIINL